MPHLRNPGTATHPFQLPWEATRWPFLTDVNPGGPGHHPPRACRYLGSRHYPLAGDRPWGGNCPRPRDGGGCWREERTGQGGEGSHGPLPTCSATYCLWPREVSHLHGVGIPHTASLHGRWWEVFLAPAGLPPTYPTWCTSQHWGVPVTGRVCSEWPQGSQQPGWAGWGQGP